MLENKLSIGIDIGSVNVGMAAFSGSELIYLDRERIGAGSILTIKDLIQRAGRVVPLDCVTSAGVTGSGRRLYEEMPGWQMFSSPYAAIAGVLWDQPHAKTIIEVGAQSSLVIGLGDGLKDSYQVARSPLCAAGTGRFLEQQASRLGITIEEFGPLALKWTKSPPRIAARCSVFAKSDLIHLQQKGWSVDAMLAGLSDSVARMVRAQWKNQFNPPVIFIGGVAGNEGVIRALSDVLDGEVVIVPPHHASRGAMGAALLARTEQISPSQLVPTRPVDTELKYIPNRLFSVVSLDGWQPAELSSKMVDVALGVDVGSTSTKAAVINAQGEVLAKTYLMTAGQPLEAVKQVMANLVPIVEGKVRVMAVGVTGSGRYLVGNFIGADTVKNEITAQTRAALQIDPQVDTVFEVGGQDSKYVYLENGTALDYQMNKACAAGTGSFVDELSEQLGVPTRTGEFAQMAFDAGEQLDLGEKCAAFMSQAVTSAQHEGASLETIVASLSVSLAKNYRSKVVGMRRVGHRIVLTGAVFYNQAVVSAFQAEFPGKTLVVPDHKEVTGAIGAALLALEAQPTEKESLFKGFSQLARASYKLKNFTCYHCENFCEISMMTTEDGGRLFYGSRCDRYDATGVHLNTAKTRTPFNDRWDLLFGLAQEEQHG